MSPHHASAFLGAGLAAATLVSLAPATARADGFAEPPYTVQHHVVTTSDGGGWSSDPRSSILRFLAGPAGRFDPQGAMPGLLVAVEIGRGTAGARLTGAWLDVGTQRGVSQYTGELTLDFGGHSRFRPVIGAGGGVGRTSSSVRPDGTTDLTTGSTIGVGLVRAGLGVQLPFEDTDARIGLDLSGVFPAIRGASAPPLTPWVLSSLTVGIGF